MFHFRRNKNARKSRPAAQVRKFVRRLPLSLEVLESRILLSADSWNPSAGSGNWDVGSNWSLGHSPGTGDTAIINTNSAATITIQSGDNISVQNVSTGSNDTLSFTGGALTVTSGTSTLSGALSMSGGTLTATGSGVSLTANGSTSIAGASLTAESGASLSLPELTSYASGSNTFLQADGVGSVLDLSALTSISQTDYTHLDATTGGTLKLTGLTSLSSPNNNIQIQDTGGSTLVDSNLATLNQVSVTTDGSDTHLADAWTKFTASTLTVSGGSYSLAGLTDVDDSSLNVQSGGSLILPKLVKYASGSSTFLQADGVGSVLDLSALTSISQTDYTHLYATTGGTLKLIGLTSLSSPNSNIQIQDTGGSTLVDSNLATLNQVSVTTDGSDTHLADAWTKFTASTLTVSGGSYSLAGLTDIDDSSLFVQKGGSLTLPKLIKYASGSNTFLQADGVGSVLDLSALTSISQTDYTHLYATTGGTLKLTGLTSLSSSNNNIQIQDTGGSVLLDSNLSTFSGVSVTTDGSDAHLADAWTKFTGGTLSITGGSLSFANLASFTGGTLSVTGGSVSFPKLTDFSDSKLQLSSGASVIFAVLTKGNIELTNGTSVTLQGTVISMPVDGTSGATINVPSSPELTITLEDSGTKGLTDTTINVGQGSNVVLEGGTYLGTTTFNVAQGATVDLTGGQTTTYGGTLTGSGAGTVLLSSGDFYPASGGGVTLTFAGGLFQWTGGAMELSVGDVTNKGIINLSGANQTQIYADGTLDNFGTIIQTGTGDFGLHSSPNASTPTTLKIETGGHYLIESDAGINNVFNNTSTIINAGTIRKTAGSGTSTIAVIGSLSNTGVIEADSGTLDLEPTSFAQIAGTTLTAGTWNALNGATLKFPTGTSIAANQANVSLAGSGASVTALAGLNSNSGSLSLTDGATLSSTSDLSNSGSLTVGSGGTLSVGGNFTQTAAGTLNDPFGSTSGSGQVAVSGTAALAGNFNVELPNGFAPNRNAVYPVMTYASTSGTFATITGLGSYLTEQFNPTSVYLVNGTGTPVALQMSQVTAPTTATTGQLIAVNWQVSNSGSTAATGSWQDSVYLSTTQTITGSSILLGSVTHSGGLAASGSYNGSLKATVPALPPGNYYVLVQTDSLDQVLVVNRANDIMAANPGPLAVSVPALTLGTPSNGTFSAADQDQYYQVTVPAGGSLQVSLTSAASSGALALYASAGTQPTPYSYQEAATLAGQPNQSLNVPTPGAGTYYILVHSVSGAAATAGYTLTVTQTNALTIAAPSSPWTGGNGGNLTIDIKGTNFSPNTTASLTGPAGGVFSSTTINASTIFYQSASEIYATFDLKAANTGNYALSVQDGSEKATAPAAVSVVPYAVNAHGVSEQVVATRGLPVALPPPPPVELVLTPPSAVRAGRQGIVYVTATNVSNNDVLAPLLGLTADDATLQLPGSPYPGGSSLIFLATSPTGPAGILRPGESVQVAIQFQSATTTPTINFQLSQADDSQPMDWSAYKSTLQPSNIPSSAWDAIYANFTAAVGSTVGSYHQVLANDATYLSQLGENNNDVSSLVDFELDKAADDFITPTLTTVTDVSFPAPGLPLTFVRSFQQPLDRRSIPGPFGMGWTDNWQLSLGTDAHGNVTINDNEVHRYFALQSDGAYQPGPGDFATLTLSKGTYTLHETDGSLLVFNADGTLNYQQDSNGNRITCGYTNGLLTSLTSNDGQQITIAYKPGTSLIQQITAPDGQTTTYTYDSSDQHLISYTDQYGTTNYTYLTGQSNPAQANALSVIAYADNTHLYFGYDSQGRLIDQHRDNGQEDISYSYLPVNGYTATDGDGNKTTYLIDNAGNVGEVIDPLGNVTQYSYDINGNATQVAAPLGVTYSYSYDAKGNLISETDALGFTTTFTYDSNNNLTSYTDAKGNTTSYSYDASNNLLSITYADGNKQQYTNYNPLGEAQQFINARGDAIGFTYNPQGQVLTESFADGTSFSYTYDSHGNLTTAKDAQGNVTTFDYTDPNNPNLLTEVEYPDGTYLKFQYNIAGQRIQSADQTGFTVNYKYDALGRLSTLTDGNKNLIVQYTYDNAGNLIQKDMGNGTRTVYKYDAAGDVLSITNYAPDHTTVNSFDKYTYDALGNVLTDTNQDGQWVYTYDADSQLVQAVFTPNSSDPDGLTAQNLQYVYDAAGNRISETVNGVTTTYVVNNVNEYTSTTTNGVTTSYQYDLDGNMIAQTTGGNTTNYTFNDLNQLTAVNGPNLSASYAYDPLGNRVSQTVNGVTTKFQIDPAGPGNVAAEFDSSGNVIAHYTYGFGLVSQVTASGSAGYYDFDLTGNTVGITGSAGTYVNRYTYLPFGQTTTIVAAASNPFTLSGQFGVMDDRSGTLDMRVRNYDPITGAFVSKDPLGLGGGDTNTRRYAANDPTFFVDPMGLAKTGSGNTESGKSCRVPARSNDLAGRLKDALRQFASGPPVKSSPIQLALVGVGLEWAGIAAAALGVAIAPEGGIVGPSEALVGAGILLLAAGETAAEVGEVLEIAEVIHGHGDPSNASGPGGFVLGGAFANDPGCGDNSPPFSLPIPPALQKLVDILKKLFGFDPNALIGPAGYGTQGFIQPGGGTWPYTIQFENDGSAAAQNVTVTEQLDPNLDWSTFQLGSFGFGSVNVAIPAGLTQYQTTVSYHNEDGTALNVQVSLNFNVQTGLLTVTFISIDPTTGQAPAGVFDGFLPPDNSSGIGEGFVQYIVQPKSGLASGAAIGGQASVVFDTNAAINTNTVTNAIDATPPTSSVNPLPATVNSPSFTVSWSGSQPNGPGIASYNVYVSDNGGAFTPWLTNTTQTSATYTGQVGHTYSFSSVATDAAGLTQPTPTAAQASTYVWVPPSPPSPPPPPPPPTLQVPPLLAFLDSILGGIETINSDGTETITDSLFGIPLFVSTFNSAGALTSVTLFGINITFLFE